MQHTGVTFILLLTVTVVCSQTSTNPAGAPFFSPSLVRELPLNNNLINSTILGTPSDYADFYWVNTENVGEITITAYTTNLCDYTVRLLINFPTPNSDDSVSFPCWSGEYLCGYDTDASLYVSDYGQDPSSTTLYAGPSSTNFRPGEPIYITASYYYSRKDFKRVSGNCNYTIQAKSEFNCSAGSVLVKGDVFYCSTYTNVTSNGQTFTGVASTNESTGSVYRLDIPKNVTYVYAWVTSQDSSSLTTMVTAGYAAAYPYSADTSTSEYGGTLASNSSLYVYLVEYYEPLGDLPLFFSLAGATDGSPFSISIYWVHCPGTTGIPRTQGNFSTATMNVLEPGCNSPVTFLDFQSTNYSFNVPAYNSSTDINGGTYSFLDVPIGSYGAINFSCVSSVESYIIYSKDQSCDCNGPGTNYLNCDGRILALISQDLYSGGYWTFGACNGYNQPINITVIVSSSVTVPPSPSPVPSPGSSTGQDSSTGILASSPGIGMMLIVAVTFLIQL